METISHLKSIYDVSCTHEQLNINIKDLEQVYYMSTKLNISRVDSVLNKEWLVATWFSIYRVSVLWDD